MAEGGFKISKKVAYELGEWDAPTPPVSTLNWKEKDWIKWIDENHGWFVPIRD